MMTNSNVQQAVPFFYVHEMEASRRFYVDGLGFTLTKEWIVDDKLRWCWLQLGAAAIMLQEFWREGPNRYVPETPVGLGVSISFTCQDALALYREFTARGVKATRPFVGNAMWMVEVADPDGYKLSFASPTDMEEETVLAQRDEMDTPLR